MNPPPFRRGEEEAIQRPLSRVSSGPGLFLCSLGSFLGGEVDMVAIGLPARKRP